MSRRQVGWRSFGLLGQGAREHGVDVGWQVGIDLARRRRLVLEVGEQGGGDGVALQGRAAGEAFVEHAAERVEVGAPVDGARAAICSGAT